ncbi:MAG TPA: hypothetical protein VFE50_06205 [Cyclobacteriaceae bacterium]|nr:hypothetical protein [Cyclobacteriaceae bacterium]
MKKPKKKFAATNLSKEPDFTISPRLQEAFVRFLEYHPAKRLSLNLRSWLLEFLMYDGSAEAEYLYHLVTDLSGLFDLLEVIQEEWKGGRFENESSN